MPLPSPIAWTEQGSLRILDQTLLPAEERHRELTTVDDVAEAIRRLRVRGAPLIGIAAAMGVTLALSSGSVQAGARDQALAAVDRACEILGATRPTAVNLHWALRRMRARAHATPGGASAIAAALRAEAQAIWDEDRAMCRRIGEAGLELIPDGSVVCTICNAGVLATGGIGTALAPIYLAHELGRQVRVIVPETRPLLQGARLTAWELSRAGIPVTLITDGMVASRLRLGDVACVITGADRIAANGDAANKIGTYALALAARAHGVPLYVAAPASTVDLATPDGAAIPIEERPADEVTAPFGRATAPAGVGVWNPAFDVTPASLIRGILTDRGLVAPADLAARFRP
ncbi:MAG: S-methyl-5-thioribose-1-phosphate isomerase [Gemmatimonadota bacterium]